MTAPAPPSERQKWKWTACRIASTVAITSASTVASPERTTSARWSISVSLLHPRQSRPRLLGDVPMNASSLRPRVGDGARDGGGAPADRSGRVHLDLLYRHRVFTTDQLAEVYFDNTNAAQQPGDHALQAPGSWDKPSRWRRLPWGRHSGRTRRSGCLIGYGSLRLRLAELATVPIPPESEEGVAETQAYRRRTEEGQRERR